MSDLVKDIRILSNTFFAGQKALLKSEFVKKYVESFSAQVLARNIDRIYVLYFVVRIDNEPYLVYIKFMKLELSFYLRYLNLVSRTGLAENDWQICTKNQVFLLLEKRVQTIYNTIEHRQTYVRFATNPKREGYS